jgi:hypothetical protein
MNLVEAGAATEGIRALDRLVVAKIIIPSRSEMLFGHKVTDNAIIAPAAVVFVLSKPVVVIAVSNIVVARPPRIVSGPPPPTSSSSPSRPYKVSAPYWPPPIQSALFVPYITSFLPVPSQKGTTILGAHRITLAAPCHAC